MRGLEFRVQFERDSASRCVCLLAAKQHVLQHASRQIKAKEEREDKEIGPRFKNSLKTSLCKNEEQKKKKK